MKAKVTPEMRAARIAAYRAGRAAGENWHQMAARVCMTASTLRRYLAEIPSSELGERASSREDMANLRYEALKWGVENSKTWAEMARHAKCHPETFRDYCRRNFHDKFPEIFLSRDAKREALGHDENSPLSVEEINRRREAYHRARATGMTLQQLARELEIRRSTLGRWLNRQGLEWITGKVTKVEFSTERTAARPRKCLCCGDQFMSTGPGNRMCHSCRGQSASPYHPASDGDGGRRVGRAR